MSDFPLLTIVLLDAFNEIVIIAGHHFGDCIEQPASSYITGNIVTAKFVSGHLRNNLMLESSFLTVERQEGTAWLTVARDAEWETRMGECRLVQ